MSDVSIFLLSIAAIFIIGIVGELVFERTGVPDVIWLIVVGIVIGPVSGLVSKAQLTGIAPYFGALTLVVVLFDGGSELRLKELSQAAGRSSLLAITSFILSVAALSAATMGAAMVGILPEGWTWLHSIIVGCILGGSSSVVIMPALRKAGLAPKIANLVNLESAITDVLCVVATVACINIAVSGSADAGESAITLAKSFGIGLGVGVVAGLISVLFLRRLKRSSYAYPLILGVLLVLYAFIDELGGSAALGILAVAVMVGNAPALSKVVGLEKSARLTRGVQNVHDEITFIIKSFFFTFIGAMLSPPWDLLLLGVFLGLILLVARVPAALIGTARSDLSKPARGLVMVSMPRGMAAGVLAMMPSQRGVPATGELPVVVFAAVLTTIVVFAVGFPVLKKRLAQLDPGALVPVLPRRPADASMSTMAGESLMRDDATSFPPAHFAANASSSGDYPAPQSAAPSAEPAGGALPAAVAEQLAGREAEATTVDEAIPLTTEKD